MTWRERAACLDRPDLEDVWIGDDTVPDMMFEAQRVCWGCEVVEDCYLANVAGRHPADVAGVVGGTTERDRRRMRAPGTKPLSSRRCALNGCESKHYAQGLCQSHYQRRWRERAS